MHPRQIPPWEPNSVLCENRKCSLSHPSSPHLLFSDRARGPGCPQTHCVAEDDLELLIVPLYLPSTRQGSAATPSWFPLSVGDEEDVSHAAPAVSKQLLRGGPHVDYTHSAYATLHVNRTRKPCQYSLGLCIHFILETWSSWLGLAPPLGITSFWRIPSLISHSGLSLLPVEGTSGTWHLLPTQATCLDQSHRKACRECLEKVMCGLRIKFDW